MQDASSQDSSSRNASQHGPRIEWETGTLWSRLKAQSAHGLSTGALQSIETRADYVEDGGVRFLVRILANLDRKEKARSKQGKTKPANPFLPYDQDLYVSDISASHVCLLNKFNVSRHHFLIVTREFESQKNWLTVADFEALLRCLSEVNGLGFFNGGTLAGASQAHKHLQVVPYGKELSAFPMDEVIEATAFKNGIGTDNVGVSEQLPFRHAIARCECPVRLIKENAHEHKNHLQKQIRSAAQRYLKNYQRLLAAVGIVSGTASKNASENASENGWEGQQTAPYNLLCTREWMMVVPRSQEKAAEISVNSLGYAGSLLAKNEQAMEYIKTSGPMNLLRQVGYEP